MITHYDMTTGEVITDEVTEHPCATNGHSVEQLVALRLLTVEEATATQAGTPTLCAGIAMIPVDLLLPREP